MVTCQGHSCYYNQERLIYLPIKSLGELTVELLVLGFTKSQRAKHGKKNIVLSRHIAKIFTYFYTMLSHDFKALCGVQFSQPCQLFICCLCVKLLREERRLQITKYTNIKHCKACDPCLWIHTHTHAHTYFETQICIDLFLMWCFHLHINTPLIQCIPLDGV